MKALRRLREPKTGAVDGLGDGSTGSLALEGVGERGRSNCAVNIWRDRLMDRPKELQAGKRPSGVVDEHDVGIDRDRVKPIRNGMRSGLAPRDDPETCLGAEYRLDVTEPTGWRHDDDFIDNA